MKKLIALAVVALVGTGFANAKLVRSRTVGEKEKSPTTWIIRTGLSVNNAAGAGKKNFSDVDVEEGSIVSYSVGARCGWDLSVAFNKPMGNSGAYWGMELGLGSRGASAKTVDEWMSGGELRYENSKQHIATWNIKYSPFTFGYKYALNQNIKLDGHLGAFVSYDFAGSGKASWTSSYEGDYVYDCSLGEDVLDTFQRLDIGMQIGVGVWYKNFNFDITYQRGFIKAIDTMYDDDYDGAEINLYSSNLMLRVGYAF